MIRLACLLVLIALAIAVIMAIHPPSGATAILFSFVGMPALAAGVLVFGVSRWREGALSWSRKAT